MEECIFCKIIKGEIPCAKVYEDEDVFAFLDIGPVNKGHTLVISKEHYRNMLEMPDDLLAKLIIAAKKVALAVKHSVGSDGINIGISNEKAAGQLVMHTHVHVIPRFNDDGFRHWPQSKYKEGEMDKIKEKIIKFIKE